MVIRTASVVLQPQIINSWVIYREAVLKRAIQSGEMTEVALRLVKGDELDKAPLNPFGAQPATVDEAPIINQISFLTMFDGDCDVSANDSIGDNVMTT